MTHANARSSRRLELLARADLFRGVPPALLQRIDADLREVSFRAGEVVFEAGEPGDAVYLVERGTLLLQVSGVTLLARRVGECVGEFALIDDEPRSAAAVALSDVHLLRWERADFQRMLAEDADVARGIFRLLTGKLRESVDAKVRMLLERERWRQDLARAREIQAGMLPPREGVFPGLEVAGVCRPVAEVGGDYYDCIDLGAGRVGIVIADVTGHAFYSGLFVAMAKSCIHTQSAFGHEPPEVMRALRRALALSLERRLLMTCCYVLIDGDAGTLAWANAGHPYPYLARGGSPSLDRLEALDPILGAVDAGAGAGFEQRLVPWTSGDRLVLYTDGVTEARSESGEPFGHERLEEAIASASGTSAVEARESVLDALARHVGTRAQSDDLTLVVVRRP